VTDGTAPPDPDDALDPDRCTPPPDAPGESAVCPYCDTPFVEERLLALHRGLEHDGLTDEERDAYAEAVEGERDALRLFRLKALAWLLVLYFGFIYVYAFVL
jgi:hypothetical protein